MHATTSLNRARPSLSFKRELMSHGNSVVEGIRQMLACIACSKHGLEDGGDDDATNPNTKEAVKSLTSQIKDMVSKFSRLRRQCRGSSSSFRSQSAHHHYPNHDSNISDDEDLYGHLHQPSTSSTPAWAFTNSNDEAMGKGKRAAAGDSCGMAALEDVVMDDDSLPKEWVAQVEPGVHISLVSLPGCSGNDLKRIRFSREMFNKWQAQRWWGENYERIMELYNVQLFDRQVLSTPPISDDGGQGQLFCSRMGSTREDSITPPIFATSTYQPPPPLYSTGKAVHYPAISSVPDPSEQLLQRHLHSSITALAFTTGVSADKTETFSADAPKTTTSSGDEASVSIGNASDLEATEWVEEDEPGVYITIRELADGIRDLRQVRFSRERFGEVDAKMWWEENRSRILAQYL